MTTFKFEKLDFKDIANEIENKKRLMWHKTEKECDYEHATECVENDVLVSLITFKDKEWYEIYDPTHHHFIYDFEGYRCETATDLVLWIKHLSEKNWITKEHIRQLIEISFKEKGDL